MIPAAARSLPQAFERLLRLRLVLVTGKGGVGRSSTASALARAAARAGKRVAVTELGELGTDDSPLARHFGQPRLPAERESLAPGIEGGRLVSRRGHELFLASVLRTETLARAALNSEAVRRLFEAAPSLREMGMFYHLLTWLKEKLPGGEPRHEIVILDMPATGHSLALTGLPESLLKIIPRGALAKVLREGQSFLSDPELGAAYVVTIPEAVPVSESFELIEGLKRTQVSVGGVILNRMPTEGFSAEEAAAARRLIAGKRILGSRLLARWEECVRSAERLRSGVGVPILEVPEAPAGVREVSEFIAAALEGR